MPRFRKRREPEDRPNLLETMFSVGCTRLAVISLHPGAGARTVVESIAAEYHRRGVPVGVTRAPRVRLEADDFHAQIESIPLPEGTIVATTSALAEGQDELEPVESADARTALGDVGLYRMLRAGNVRIYGPDDPASLARVTERLEVCSGGLALVDGAWERRRFAGPDVVQGVVLVVGAAFSDGPERSVAALLHMLELLRLPRCTDERRAAWEAAAAEGRPLALIRNAEPVWLDTDDADPLPLLAAHEANVSAIAVPGRLRNEFLAPLGRSSLRCTLVIRDPTYLDCAAVHWASWRHKGGDVEAVEPMQVLAIATNPSNPTGTDADPDAFRRLVAEALPDLPVYDVRLDSDGRGTGRRWWRRRR